VTRRLGHEPVIVVRDRDGAVQVLANRCSHRGTALCWQAKGHAASFQCTYHAWTFALDGELRGVPYPGGFDADKADLGWTAPARSTAIAGSSSPTSMVGPGLWPAISARAEPA